MLIILRDQRVKAQSGHFHMGESNLLSIRTLSTKLHQINVYTIHHPVEKLLEKNTSTVHNKNIHSKIPFWQQVNDADHVV